MGITLASAVLLGFNANGTSEKFISDSQRRSDPCVG